MEEVTIQAPSDGQGILQRNGRWRRNISATKYGPFAFRVSRKVTSRLRGHSPEKTRHRILFPWRNRATMTRGLKWPIALTGGVEIAAWPFLYEPPKRSVSEFLRRKRLHFCLRFKRSTYGTLNLTGFILCPTMTLSNHLRPYETRRHLWQPSAMRG